MAGKDVQGAVASSLDTRLNEAVLRVMELEKELRNARVTERQCRADQARRMARDVATGG